MRRKKVSRTLTFLMAVAVVAGSIHWAAADEQGAYSGENTVADEGSTGEQKDYEAPILFVEQGEKDVDLMKNIVYDKSKWTLAVIDNANFNSNTLGAYEVKYRLTEVKTKIGGGYS